jgi:RHS repeat-associated protein
VVQAGSGANGAFEDRGDAERFGWTHDTPPQVVQAQAQWEGQVEHWQQLQQMAQETQNLLEWYEQAEAEDKKARLEQETQTLIEEIEEAEWQQELERRKQEEKKYHWHTRALTLLEKSLRGQLTSAEEHELSVLSRDHLVASAAELRDLYRRMERLGEGWRPFSISALAEMKPKGYADLKWQVAYMEKQQAKEQTPAPRSITHSIAPTQPKKQKPLETILGYYEQIQALSQATDPVLLHSGEFIYEQTLLCTPGRGLNYVFHLSYHSQLIYDGPLGWGWEHNYDRRFVPADGGSLALKEGVGRFDVYSFDGAEFTPPAGRYTALVSATTGITLTDRDGGVESYYPLDGSADAGRLRAIADRNRNTLQFAYDGNGRLQTVTDALGRAITYAYDGSNRISGVTDFAGCSVTLTYDDNGDLVSITTPAVTGTPNSNDFPLGKTTIFSYTSGFEDERLNHNLTTIIAPNEAADGSLTPRTINTYGTEGFALDRVVGQSWGGGRASASGVPAGGEVTLVYTTAIAADAPAGAANKVTITDRGGNEIELWHDSAGHRLRKRQVVGGQPLATDYAYNADGQRTSVAYPAGNRIEYVYDDGATDRLTRGNLLEMRRIPDGTRGCDGVGGAGCANLVTTYTYEPSFQLLQTTTNARGHTITRTYDAQGNLAQVAFPDATATESWTYNNWGQPLTFTDPEGNVTCYEYDTTTGYRQRIIRDCGPSTRSGQAQGVTTEYGYDSVGNVTAITDSLGIRTEYTVNELGQVVKETRAATTLDYETLYWYDANDNLVRVDVENVAPDLDGSFHLAGTHSHDAANPWLTTVYTYDLLDNVVRQTREVTTSSQITIEYRYDPLENLVSVTDPEGNRVEYSYDECNLLRETTWAAGAPEPITNTYEYDSNGNLVQTADGEGHLTDYVYDGFDRRVGSVDALGNVRVWEYDENSNVVVAILRDGQDGRNPGRVFTATAPVTLTHSLSYFDERNRLYRREQGFFTADVGSGVITPLTTDGDGDGWVETAYTYDRNGNTTAITDDNGNATWYAYDGLDRLVLATDALSNSTSYEYDGNGNLVQIVATERQPDGLTADETFTTTRVFDAANRLIQMTDNLGQANRYGYDSRGNLVFVSDGNDNTTLFAYDGLNRTVEEMYHLRAGGVGSGAVTSQATMRYTYDGNGNLTRRTDPNGNTTAYEYDAHDRLTGIAYADGTTDALVYDKASNLVQQTDANDNIVTHTYDALDRRVHSDITPGAGMGGTTVQTWTWDGLSRQIAISDDNDPTNPSDDSEVAFTYDSLSNRRSEIQGSHTVSSTYDGVGNRLSLTYPSGTVVTYTYDALNRVKTIADDGIELAAYDYIGPSRLFRRTNGNGTYATFAYDRVRRVTDIAHRLSSDDSLLTGFSYTYDRVGNHTTETAQPGDATTTYTYDSLYRLTGIQDPSSSVQYTYDATGNRTRVTEGGGSTSYATNQVNEYLTVGGEHRTYDANGNLLSRRITAQAGQWFIYLPLVVRGSTGPVLNNRAPSAPNSLALNGATVVTETVISYEYDFANRLLGVMKAVTVATDVDVQVITETVRFTYDGLGRRVSKQAGDDVTRYLYDGRQVIEERDGTDSILATYIKRLKMNGGGSHIVIFYQPDALGNVRALADDAGSVVERVDYDPFGTPIFGGSESSLGNPYLFRGLRYDTESGFYVSGVRQYEPSTGRHAQRGEESLGNPYPFAGNNPISSGPS